MSDSRTSSPQQSALIMMWWTAAVVPAINQDLADAAAAHFAEGDLLRAGRYEPPVKGDQPIAPAA
jgi:hypothetical protein